MNPKNKECVYNENSEAHKKVLEIHEKDKNWEFYPGIENVEMHFCYECDFCKMWGKSPEEEKEIKKAYAKQLEEEYGGY